MMSSVLWQWQCYGQTLLFLLALSSCPPLLGFSHTLISPSSSFGPLSRIAMSFYHMPLIVTQSCVVLSHASRLCLLSCDPVYFVGLSTYSWPRLLLCSCWRLSMYLYTCSVRRDVPHFGLLNHTSSCTKSPTGSTSVNSSFTLLLSSWDLCLILHLSLSL